MKSVDILAEELAQARARGAVFSVLRRVRPWGLAFGGQRPLTAHVLVEGDGWLGFSGHEPIRLHERDAVLMTAGSPYKIVSEPGGDAIPISDARRQDSDTAPGDASTILCGAYVLDGSVAAALLASLPRAVIVAAADQDPSHVAAITLLEDEIRRDAPGQQTLLDRLLDLNLVFALRAWWARADVRAPGLVPRDVGPRAPARAGTGARGPGRDWTVPAMASLAGLSRAAFAARFRQLIGQPPGRYLTELRMQRAEDALVRSKATLAEIAAAVGYQTNSLSRPRSAGTTRCLRANGVCRSSRDRPGRAAAR
jgi:AraC-like DNA-binding protein